MDEVGREAVLLLQRVGLPGGGVQGGGLWSLSPARPNPSGLLAPPPTLCTHWLVSTLLLKVRLWSPPLICRVGAVGAGALSPAWRGSGGGRGERGGCTYHDLGVTVVGLDDGDAQGRDPLHGRARVGDEPGALGQPALQGRTPGSGGPGLGSHGRRGARGG